LRPYRKNLEEYASKIIYPVCENYILDKADIKRYMALAQRCAKEGITLYTVLPPMDNSLKDLVIEPLGIGEDILYFINEIKDYTTVLNYEYNEENPFSSDEFYDGFHLDVVRGMPRFTKMLFER
ncbi:MAG: hypothetical protein RR198_04865, partial [Oscillospiraceae bacterium]